VGTKVKTRGAGKNESRRALQASTVKRLYKLYSIPAQGSCLVPNTYPAEEADFTHLQYVDDVLLAAANQQDCPTETELLLPLLWEAGYKVSRKKAQLCQD
jgi:hypothetical protein